MKELFNLCGLCGVSLKNGRELLCSRKVNTTKDYGGHCVGYVLENVGDRYCKLQLTTNHILTLKNPRFDRDEGTYQYHNNNGSTGCVIKYHWPTWILIHTSGHRKLTLNRLAHRTGIDYISILHNSCNIIL